MKRGILCSALLSLLLPSMSSAYELEVSNPDRQSQTSLAEIEAGKVLGKLKTPGCVIIDSEGKEVPAQLTADGKLIFLASVDGKSRRSYRVIGSQKMHDYAPRVAGRFYPERNADFSWENETMGYRAYGPLTQKFGERCYGYDLFLKYPGAPVLEELYGNQCSPDNWRKVDSLKRIDPKLAKDFENSFTYHIDHGKGMDCYAVGKTLGAGAPAPLDADGTLIFPWCFSEYRVLDKGPLRIVFELDYPTRAEADGSEITETRRITCDSHALLNKCEVRYRHVAPGAEIACGFPVRDDSPTYASEDGILAGSDPTQGEGNGRPYIGIVAPGGFSRTEKGQGHLLGIVASEASGEPCVEYYFGAMWDRPDPTLNQENWVKRLKEFKERRPLKVKLK